MFHYHIKHQENDTMHSRVFLMNFKVFHLVMKHCQMLDITSQNKIILEGEIKDAKLISFSSDFQTLIKS